MKPRQMRRGISVHCLACRFQTGTDHGLSRPFAVGPCDVDHRRQVILWIAQSVQQTPDTVQRQVDDFWMQRHHARKDCVRCLHAHVVGASTAGVSGAALASSNRIAKIAFTGSTATGRKIMQSASKPIAGVTLELGGKSPVVVLGDADLDAAAAGVVRGIFFNAGQVCAAGARLICERSVHDALVKKVIAKAEALSMGHPLDNPDLGPLVSSQQLERVEGFVARAKTEGLRCATGGHRVCPDGLPNGNFYAPTVFTDVPAQSEIAQQEVFGPVLITQICDTAEQALELANGTAFGLVAGIYTADVTQAMRFARKVEAGQVFINGFLQGGDTVPFGGVKESGIGREKGLAGLAAYAAPKSIILNYLDTA